MFKNTEKMKNEGKTRLVGNNLRGTSVDLRGPPWKPPWNLRGTSVDLRGPPWTSVKTLRPPLLMFFCFFSEEMRKT